MKSRRLQIYLPTTVASELDDVARRQQTTAGALIRCLVMAWLKSSVIDDSPLPDVHREPKRCQVGVRVSKGLHERLRSVSRDYGQTPAGWTAALLARVLLGHPMYRHDELSALRESTRQLWSTGVLLNQIAKACNLEVKARGIATDAHLRPEILAACLSAVRHTADRIADLLESNRQVFKRFELAKDDDREDRRG